LFDGGAAKPYVNASKGEKPIILAWLRAPKLGTWFAAIADSGQKQVLPLTMVNMPNSRGRVRFDDMDVVLPDAQGWRIVDDMTALLTVGATKEEITSGAYGSGAWTRCRETIEQFETQWSSKRSGAFFSLAIWLAQRDEAAVQERIASEKAALAAKKAAIKAPKTKAQAVEPKEPKKAKDKLGGDISGRKGKTANDARRGDPVEPSAVSCGRSERADALGHAAQPGIVGSAPIVNGGQVGVPVSSGAATGGARQLGLFGDR
jgi:hypothetical protein